MTTKSEELKLLLNKLQNDQDCEFEFDYLSEKEPNPFEWKTVLEGTQDTIYEGGYYMLKIIFPEDYPTNTPQVYFLNKIFHPHISSSNGEACIVPPSNDIKDVMMTVRNMFVDYGKNIEHAYPGEPKKLYKTDRPKFEYTVREWVSAYAKLEDIDKYYDL